MADAIPDQYLTTRCMKDTSRTMEVASSVSEFPLIELWWSVPESEQFMCTYVHADAELIEKYPNLNVGHFPQHKTKHNISQSLCAEAKSSGDKYHWKVHSDNELRVSASGLLIRTELCVWQLHEVDGKDFCIFLIAFSPDTVEFKERKLKFMRGIGIAIHAACFMSEELLRHTAETDENLDDREIFEPRKLTATPHTSNSDLFALGQSESERVMEPFQDRKRTLSSPPIPSTRSYDAKNQWNNERVSFQGEDLVVSNNELAEYSAHSHSSVTVSDYSTATGDVMPLFTSDAKVPSWQPAAPFNFPIQEMPCLYTQLHFSSLAIFTDLKHIANGSNSNIHLGKFQNQKVIIKIIMPDVQADQVTMHEFDIEYGMLARMNHKNIIKVLGSGSVPRRFIVIEYLSGGSLFQTLNKYQTKPSLAQRLFRKPTFTYAQLLHRAREMALALQYMHSECHPGATIIHRDLKPDNVGFTEDGVLRLFDFGLVTCVKKRINPDDMYNMTGNTGSLRYMAPEVALKLPYTEKVDVYSFSIMLWQMARDRVPFNGWTKAEFMKNVVIGKQRPKLDKTWPPPFSNLLSACWDSEPTQRPDFKTILAQIDGLIYDIDVPDKKGHSVGLLKAGSARWGATSMRAVLPGAVQPVKGTSEADNKDKKQPMNRSASSSSWF
jgi:serine/threonine protein kinase